MTIPERLEQINRAHPGWQCWAGLGGMFYARRLRTSPQWLVRTVGIETLEPKITEAEREGRPPEHPDDTPRPRLRLLDGGRR